MDETIVVKKKNSVLVAVIASLVAVIIIAGGVKFFIDYRNSKIEEEKNAASLDVLSAYNASDLEAAIKAGESFLDKFPKDAESYISLANVYVQKGSVEFNEEDNANKAIDLLNKALEIDNKNANAYRLLGYAYEIKQDYNKSLEYYNKSLEIEPNNAVTLVGRGHMYTLAGDYENAEKDLVAAYSIDNKNTLALVNLAGLYIKTDRYNEYDIELFLNQAISGTDNVRNKAEVLSALGSYYYSTGDYQKASSAFNDSLLYDNMLSASWMGRAFSDMHLLDNPDLDGDVVAEIITDVFDAVASAQNINQNQTSAYMLEGMLYGSLLADTEKELALYEKALSVIDADITLDKVKKEEMRKSIQGMKDAVNVNDPVLKKERQQILLDSNNVQ